MNASITLTVKPARPELQVCNEPQLVYLFVRAQTHVAAQRAIPLNVCLVLDRSSSMRGERLFYLKEAARQVVSQMDDRSSFGLVVFNDRAEVIIPAQAICEHDTMRQTISSLEASGGTEMAQGLAVGLQEIERPKISGISRLILLTDGRTYGDEHACIELARRAQRRGIGLTALGVGTDWNEDLLETMTADPNSRTQYIASPREIVSVFEAELARLQSTIAQNVELTVTTHPEAQIRSMYRVQPFIAPLHVQEVGNGGWRAPVGEWAAGDDQTFMLELVVPPVTAGTHPIARIDLRYDLINNPGNHSLATTRLQLPAVAHASSAVDHAARRALERVFAFQLQQQAWQAVTAGKLDDATKRLQTAGTHLFNAGEVALAETVHAEATRLLQGSSTSADGRKRIKYGTRGLIAKLV
ncbi:MAG: VWA domain-containing protein [Chloroflexi bacterium]|nr:MAG: VWA domain-containing protein [Chloroflexota bacterium]